VQRRARVGRGEPLFESKQQMAHIHFIGGEKGGVGKSLTARVLAQYMIDRNIPFLGFDTDRSHGALMRFYSGYASPVVMDRYEALDVIVEAAAEQPERRVLVDLAAQTHDPLVKWMDDAGVIAMAEELGMAICYWHVMDSGKDSVDLLAKLLDRFGSGLKYVLVRNQVRGNDFSVLEQSGLQQRALELGAKIVSIKKLHEGVIQKIDAGSSSFWKAKNPQEPSAGGLGMMDRQRVKMWLRDVYREIDDVGV
jgi:CobQ/CobB/MinD/ParA nucleotide binding domain